MNIFFDLINFYHTALELDQLSAQNLSQVLDQSESRTSLLIGEVDIVNSIVAILDSNPDADMAFLKDELSFSNEIVSYYISAIQILFPNRLKVKNILGSKFIENILPLKKDVAIKHLSARKLSQLSIAEKLDIDIESIDEVLSMVPALIENNNIVETLRVEETVRDFFTVHPYYTIKESAKLLGISAQKMRSVIEKLRIAGEDIRANDIPVAIERELIGKNVIELKINQPSLTTKEISLTLGLSVREVKGAINDMVRIWQVEKAESYEFHFAKTSNSLDEIKKEAWSQHNGVTRPSSRWMEMILSATEKQMILHGLKAPEKLDIRQDIRLTKTEKDNVIDAAIAADAIDVDYSNIQITGT